MHWRRRHGRDLPGSSRRGGRWIPLVVALVVVIGVIGVLSGLPGRLAPALLSSGAPDGGESARVDAEDERPALPTSSTPTATDPVPTPATTAPASPPVPVPVTPEPSAAAPEPPAPVAPAPVAEAPSAAGSVRGAGAGLSWAPPADHAGYPVQTVTATDSLTVVDARGGDVTVVLSPDHAVGPVTIQNCRNAVLIGGRIRVLPSSQVAGYDQRAVYVKNCTGTVHVEGVQIDGDVPGSEADAIAANSPQAVLQIQNVRADGLRGGLSSNHADVFQPWGGLREYRIDRLTGTSNYQGLTTSEVTGQIGRGTIRNANIAGSDVGPLDKGGYLFWLRCEDGYPLELVDVYVAGRSGRPLEKSVWPMPDDDSCPSTIVDGMATWPTVPGVSGGVQEGSPASGDYVPAGSVGLGYSSPGYR